MLRSVLVGAALCASSCRGEKSPPKSEPFRPVKIEPPKLDLTAALQEGGGGEADGKPTGALDFELVRRGAAYVLRDEAYEITFPLEPKVEMQTATAGDGKPVQFVSALAGNDEAFYGLVVFPVRYDGIYDVAKGIDGVRDQTLKTPGSKLLSETPSKLAGLDGRRMLVSVPDGANIVYLEIRLAWDPTHRSLVNASAGSHDKQLPPAGRAFIESFVTHEKGKSPLDPPDAPVGVAAPTDALDLELVRQADGYVVRDEALAITFPSRPTVRAAQQSGFTYAAASMYAEEAEYFGLFVMPVPDHTPFDVAKGLKGAQAGMINSFSNPSRVTETKIKVSGLAAKRFQVSVTNQGKLSLLEGVLVWDAKHRTVIGASAMTTERGTTAAGRAFLDSLVIHADGKPPHAP